jgi:AraC-like DNA-binding protein
MDSPAPGRLCFDTDALPERDRFPAYCEEMIRRYAALDIVARDGGANFRARIELRRAGGIDIGYVATTPSDYVRTPSYLRDGDDALCVVLCIEGGTYQTQSGEPRDLRPGEGIVCDNAQAGGIHVLGISRFWVVKVPRPNIGRLVPQLSRFGGVKLDRDPIACRLLFGYLGAAHEIDLDGAGRAATLYDQHVIDLMALALGADGATRNLAEERGLGTVRRSAILREIERGSGDADLNAAAVARKIGVTPRYVHLLLEETGKSFTHHVLERRLEKAAALLRDPQWRYRKIADIAGEAGFTDLSYFNRMFRRHFDATPSDIREAARRQS